MVSMATHKTILKNGSVPTKSDISQLLLILEHCTTQNYTNVIRRVELYNNMLSSLSSDTLDFIMALPSCELLNVMMGGNSDMLMRIWDKSVYVKFIQNSVHFLSKIDYCI